MKMGRFAATEIIRITHVSPVIAPLPNPNPAMIKQIAAAWSVVAGAVTAICAAYAA